MLAWAPCAQATDPTAASPIVDCRSAAAISEQAAQLPPGLLLAIGLVESGRWNPLAARIDPWPWATNHAGEGRYFTSVDEAIAWVAAQQAAGVQSIDVGCFQVNLYYHPGAFASLAEAFDPAANARYAAAFLHQLHDQTGDWPAAIALYHSADPLEGQRYASRVTAVWNTGNGAAVLPFVAAVRSIALGTRHIATGGSLVRVVLPNWAVARSVSPISERAPGLPAVITPTR
jgi:soluble lytic murein transglycosylase-like protein